MSRIVRFMLMSAAALSGGIFSVPPPSAPDYDRRRRRGLVIPFPRDACRRSTGKISGGHVCTVYILAVVHTERPPPKPTKRTARKRKTKP